MTRNTAPTDPQKYAVTSDGTLSYSTEGGSDSAAVAELWIQLGKQTQFETTTHRGMPLTIALSGPSSTTVEGGSYRLTVAAEVTSHITAPTPASACEQFQHGTGQSQYIDSELPGGGEATLSINITELTATPVTRDHSTD